MLALLFANRFQGVVADAGEAIYAEHMYRVLGKIQQHQRLRYGRVAPDSQSLRLEFLVTRLGNIAGEFALEALGGGFRDRDDYQPVSVRRQFGIANTDFFAEIKRL